MTYDEDAYDVIMEKISDVPHHARLEPAARFVGQQLELLKPAVFGVMKTGIYAGPLANVRRGTVLIVAGDENGIITTHIVPNGAPFSTVATATVEDIDAAFPEVSGLSPDRVFPFVRAMLALYGAPPRKDRQDLPDSLGVHLCGLLMKTCDRRHKPLLAAIDESVRADVCPVLVFLSGPAKSGAPGKFCSAWPIAFPLAPYIQVIDD